MIDFRARKMSLQLIAQLQPNALIASELRPQLNFININLIYPVCGHPNILGVFISLFPTSRACLVADRKSVV